MKLIRNQTATCIELGNQLGLFGLYAVVFGCLLGLPIAGAVNAATTALTDPPILEFIQPSNNAVFSTLDEIPIVLRSSAPGDVISSADVFVNQQKLARVSYCCWLCPCFRPGPGQELILQIPVPWEGGRPSTRTWQGWTNVSAGIHWLTARAVGENGTKVEATPVRITVFDRTLHLIVNPDGSVALVIPQGSLTEGSYDLEASEDLRAWTRLGAFDPGNVAAFYFDVPPGSARRQRFYRSVYIPKRV